MLPAVKFATKFLKGATFTVDRFAYQSISLQPQEHWATALQSFRYWQ